jgi:hypothetical protein
MAADSLQRGQDFRSDLPAALERRAELCFALVERYEAALDRGNLAFDAAHARRHVDQLPVELAAVVADGFDFALELAFGLARLLLIGADRLQLLIALFERVEHARACRRRGASRRRGRKHGRRGKIGHFTRRTWRGLRVDGDRAKRRERNRRDNRGPRQAEPPIPLSHQQRVCKIGFTANQTS